MTYDPLATDWKCYTDGPNRTMNSSSYGINDGLTIEMCSSFCKDYTYFGVEYSNECYCDNTLPDSSLVAEKSMCNKTCDGNQSELCGGTWFIAIYSSLHISSSIPTQTSAPTVTITSTVRVTQTTAEEFPQDCSSPQGAIVGGTIGGVAGLILLGILAWYLRGLKREQKVESKNPAPSVYNIFLSRYKM